MSFNIGFVSVQRLFPTKFVTSVFGLVNFISHIVTCGSPIVAELSDPVPFMVFSVNAACGLFFGL